MGDNLARELPWGLRVGKFPADAAAAKVRRSADARSNQIRGTYRAPRQRRWRGRGGVGSCCCCSVAGLAYQLAKPTVQPNGPAAEPALPKVQQVEAPLPPALHLTVPATIVAQPSSQVPLRVRIGPADAAPPKSFLLLSGLPPAISPSSGRAIGAGEWAIPLAELASLTVNVPADVSGDFELIITLLSSWDGTRTRAAQARTTLVIAPARTSPHPAEVALRAPAAEPDRSSSEPVAPIRPAETESAAAIAPALTRTSARPTSAEAPSPVPAPVASRGSSEPAPPVRPAETEDTAAIAPAFTRTSARPAAAEAPSRVSAPMANRSSEPARAAGRDGSTRRPRRRSREQAQGRHRQKRPRRFQPRWPIAAIRNRLHSIRREPRMLQSAPRRWPPNANPVLRARASHRVPARAFLRLDKRNRIDRSASAVRRTPRCQPFSG